MSNLYLRNNIIAFIVHVFIVMIVYVPNQFDYPGNQLFYPGAFLPKIINVIQIASFFGYVVCGLFLLKLVEKYSFLSVISLPIIILVVSFIVIAIRYSQMGGDAAFYYYAVNPITIFLLGLNLPAFLQVILTFLSPLIPSLLMWLGMVLRKLFKV